MDKRIDVLATALKAGMTVHDLAELELAYAPPYGSAKDPVNLAGMAAQNVLAGDVALAQWNEVALLDPKNDAAVAGLRPHLRSSTTVAAVCQLNIHPTIQADLYSHKRPSIRRLLTWLHLRRPGRTRSLQTQVRTDTVVAHTVARGEIIAEVMGTGTLEARVKTTISWRIQERLAEVLVDQGTR